MERWFSELISDNPPLGNEEGKEEVRMKLIKKANRFNKKQK